MLPFRQTSYLTSKTILVLLSLVVTIIFVSAVSLNLGVSRAQGFDVLAALSKNFQAVDRLILFELRLPRIILTIIVGGALSMSGAVMQGVFRNPLADPGLIGVSAGAALGASVAIVLGANFFPLIASNILLPAFAFLFALLAMLLVYAIAKQGEYTQVATLLLAGVALSAMCTALSALIIYFSDNQQLRSLTFWQLGSFSGSSWQQVWIALLVTIPASIILWSKAKYLNVLLLGEAQAKHLGVSVEILKRNLLVLVSLIVGVSVSMVGLIGFVGLIIPHVVRLCFGADHRFLLPVSYFLGALFLLLTDTVARTIISPVELPIGILTALVGCPFFIYLLLQHRKKILF